MFSHEELQSLDPKYFSIIAVDEYDVTPSNPITPATTGACTVRAIRSREQLSYFIRILLPVLTISMEGQAV